jgi:hypothetical protein
MGREGSLGLFSLYCPGASSVQSSAAKAVSQHPRLTRDMLPARAMVVGQPKGEKNDNKRHLRRKEYREEATSKKGQGGQHSSNIVSQPGILLRVVSRTAVTV